MKRIALFAVLLLIIILTCVYLFLPSEIKVTRQMQVYTPEQAVFKYVIHPRQWYKWWPAAQTDFVPIKSTVTQVAGKLLVGKDTVINTLTYDVRGDKSIYLTCKVFFYTGLNPVKRVTNYLLAKTTTGQLDDMLSRAKAFLESDKHVYGIHVEKKQLQDSLVLTTKRITKDSSTTAEIYGMISSLKDYAAKYEAKQTGNPIVNITRLDKDQYLTMVAIPVNKYLAATNDIYIKKMVYHSNMLSAVVKGGNNSVSNALGQLSNYMKDNIYTAPAIPFEEFITDRSAEPDSSKWVTRICYPVL
ncbi:GyrI-like domain-containing protein [Mucilaginibacter agri]|uniref:AraC family transcriptional regulator n=1 Tax=Mucilaginibacter agri TaxID=2695265 RepID=A0A965ZMH3_9SPHI|nr:GyrI-like domain-containing protein [Mucilaginibacter agri]NCD72306.1 hypothetical protein [Mucilaginibacter agri]